MNTSSSLLAIALIAAIGATTFAAGYEFAPQQQAVVKLERVVITGKRAAAADMQLARIEQLPRVLIEGRRAAQPASTQVAEVCVAQTLC